MISIFDLFKIGIGPSSSHTVGPMRAARRFLRDLRDEQLLSVRSIKVDLYGSLALTGKGHGTDRAILLGLSGEEPDHVDPATAATVVWKIQEQGVIRLLGMHVIKFDPRTDLLFHSGDTLPRHSNGMRFTVSGDDGLALSSRTFYSIGGGTFFLFGTHKTPQGMVLTVVDVLEPQGDDLDSTISIVRFREPYSLRAALEKQRRGLCVGVIHSHPENFGVRPSPVDDDMDGYYMDYFPAFGNEKAYFSLIFAKGSDGKLCLSGRGWNHGTQYQVTEMVTVSYKEIRRDMAVYRRAGAQYQDEYRERFRQIYGADAAARLRQARIAIIGTSGTGSPAAHVLARAGVNNFVLVDPQQLAKSNLERLHGSYDAHFAKGEAEAPFKVAVLKDLIKAVNPNANVTCIVGNILQPLARDYVVGADLIICGTDTNHSRTAISELAYRYLVPAIDVGVVFESTNGSVAGEIARLTFYSPGGPCAQCLGLVDPWRATVELMSEEERDRRRRDAKEAELRGDNAGAYWKDVPEIPTVGHFTSMAGALVASYAIGWLTGKFAPPHRYFEFNILAPGFDYVGFNAPSRSQCYCETMIGHADQGAHASMISAPSYWSEATLL